MYFASMVRGGFPTQKCLPLPFAEGEADLLTLPKTAFSCVCYVLQKALPIHIALIRRPPMILSNQRPNNLGNLRSVQNFYYGDKVGDPQPCFILQHDVTPTVRIAELLQSGNPEVFFSGNTLSAFQCRQLVASTIG